MTRLFIFGAGDHGRKVYHHAVDAGWQVVAFVADTLPTAPPIANVPIFVASELARPGEADRMFVAIGAGDARRNVMSRMSTAGWKIASLVHRSAWVAPDAFIGEGVLVAAGAIVETGAVLERGAIIDVGAIVDHDCQVASFSHVRPGTVLPPRTKVSAAPPATT